MTTRLHYVMAYVADMQHATRFYRDTLGLPLKFASPYWTEFSTGETTLVLHPAVGEHVAGSFGLGFHVPDLQAFTDAMAERGVRCTLPPSPRFGTMLTRFLDADGTEFTVGEDEANGAPKGS